jgi:gas vesicle protein
MLWPLLIGVGIGCVITFAATLLVCWWLRRGNPARHEQ